MSLQTAAQRRSKLRADARRVILDAAESLLAEGGYEAFSIRRLTERCGYTAPSIYHHFGDKLGLIDALLEEHFAELLKLIGGVPASDDPLDTIRARARAFVGFGLGNPTHYRDPHHAARAGRRVRSRRRRTRAGCSSSPGASSSSRAASRPEHSDLAQQSLLRAAARNSSRC